MKTIANFLSTIEAIVETHKRIIKPWKRKRSGTSGNYLGDEFDDKYNEGWNDCVAEVERMHKQYMKTFEAYANENGDIPRP